MYKELNLKTGASLDEIKAAYRKLAKNYHPDSNLSQNAPDPEKFSRVHDAYKGLLREVMEALGDASLKSSAASKTRSGASYVFIGKRSMGLDTFYDLILTHPEENKEVTLNLPWTRKEACPRCLGQGAVMERKGKGFIYKARRCEKCEGLGYVEEETRIEITLTPEMLQRGKVRLKNAGGYAPKAAKRGDLIITLEFRDKLPREN
jgi:DnaJ-class molecular chaperone